MFTFQRAMKLRGATSTSKDDKTLESKVFLPLLWGEEWQLFSSCVNFQSHNFRYRAKIPFTCVG